MKLNIQLFATNTVNRKANSYSSTTAYQFRVTVTETGNTSGNTREVQIVYDVKATNPGGYEYMKKPYAYVYIDGTQEKSKQILDIWPRGEWITLFSFKKYLEAGTTHTIRGRYNSNDTTSYMPLKGNVDCDVSISLLGIASVLNSISLENTYGTFSYNKKNASFYDVITFTSNGKTLATVNNPKTTIGDYSGTASFDMSQVLAASTAAGSKTITVSVNLKTYTDSSKTTQVGDSSSKTQAITLGSSTGFDTSQSIANNGIATVTPTFTKWNAGTVCDLTISGGTYSETFTNVSSGTAQTLNNANIFNAMGTNTSLNVTVKLTTKSASNGAILGEIQLSKTLTLPNYSINVTSSSTDLNNSVEVGGYPLSYYKPNANTMIKGLSNPRITYTVSSSTGYLYGRNITTSGAESQTISTGASTNVVVEPGTNMNASYTLTASDGRKSNSKTESFTLANYFNPSISPIEITRPDGPTAPKFYVSVNGTFFNGTNLTNLSDATLLVQWSNDNNTWNTLGTVNDTDGSITYSTTYTSSDTDFYKKPVYIKATLTDRIGNQTTLTNNIPPGQPVFNTYKNSAGDNYMRINGELNIEDDLNVSGNITGGNVAKANIDNNFSTGQTINGDLSSKSNDTEAKVIANYNNQKNIYMFANSGTVGIYSTQHGMALSNSGSGWSFNGNSNSATNDQNGVNISNGYLRSYAQSNYNCNTCYNAGLYMVGGGSNCPSGSQYGSLLTLPYRKTKDNTSPDFAVQLFMPNGDDASGIKSALYVRTSIGNSWDSWKRLAPVDDLFYSSGNTETFGNTDGRSNYVVNGYVTSSTTSLYTRIITPKRLDNISSITCTSCNVEARGDKGYLNSESGYHQFVGRSGYTVECYKQSNNSFNLYIKKSSAFTNVTNNTLISLGGQFTFRFN